MRKTLHFTVHPNILNIIRQAYWYEDRKEWAMKCMKAIGSEMTLKLADQLLGGDAHFITEDGGKTLTVVFENEKEFKKELQKHMKFKAKQKKRHEKLKRELELKKDKLKYGYFSTPSDAGIQMQVSLIEKQIEKAKSDISSADRLSASNNNIARQIRLEAMNEKDPYQREILMSLNKQFNNKVFEFVFKGKHYTAQDSARSQSHCPHCDAMGSDGFWNPMSDKKSFVGVKKLGHGNVALCFECPKCFEKFYYHTTEDSFMLKRMKVKK